MHLISLVIFFLSYLEFSLCLKDPNVPAVTLKCRYLKDFQLSETEDATSGNQTTKCGPNGAKEITYMMDTGYATSTVKYSNLQIFIEKPMNTSRK